MDNKGICTGSNYPYTAKDETCKSNQTEKVAPLIGFVNVRKTEVDLTAAIANEGLISVAIHAGLDSFRFYSKGIYYDRKCYKKAVDHAVVAIGYGTSAGNDYYIIRNR
jgi:cathepsin L